MSHLKSLLIPGFCQPFMTIAQPSGVDKIYRCPLTLRHISTSMSCMLYYSGKKKTARTSSPCVGTEGSFGGAGTDTYWYF